jgi:hypothetical protein
MEISGRLVQVQTILRLINHECWTDFQMKGVFIRMAKTRIVEERRYGTAFTEWKRYFSDRSSVENAATQRTRKETPSASLHDKCVTASSR